MWRIFSDAMFEMLVMVATGSVRAPSLISFDVRNVHWLLTLCCLHQWKLFVYPFYKFTVTLPDG